MSERNNASATPVLEDIIREKLKGETQQNALDFVSHLRAGKETGDFSINTLNEEDESFWIIKQNGENVCCILLNGSNPDSFTVWICGDHIGARAGVTADEYTKEAAWANVFSSCGNCGAGCSPESRRKTIFGKEFGDICTAELSVAMQFVNPGEETLDCMKKIIDIRKNDTLNKN